MPQENINIGDANAKQGDTLFSAFTKLQTMFTELFGAKFDSTIVVKQASDLENIDSTKKYLVDGFVDMGTTSIVVPEQGFSIRGTGTVTSGLFSTAPNYTMFTFAGAGSGDLFVEELDIKVSGSGSQVYNLVDSNGTHGFEINQVNYSDCTSLGEISSYRQGLEVNSSRFGGTPELTLSGNWSGGYFVDVSIVRGLVDGNYTLFKAGTGFVMNSRFRTNQNVDLPATPSFLDFSDANFPNPSTLQLETMIISRNFVFNSDDGNYTPNINASNLKSKWKGNTGIDNTFEGGMLQVTAEAATTITTQDVFEPVAGTFTASNLQHFSMAVNGQLRHDGVSPEEYKISVFGTIEGVAGNEITLKLVRFDFSANNFVDVAQQRRPISNSLGGADIATYAFVGTTKINQNDYIRLEVANNSGTGDVTLTLDSEINAEVR